MKGFLITLIGLLIIAGAAFSTLSMSPAQLGFWHIVVVAYMLIGAGVTLRGLFTIA